MLIAIAAVWAAVLTAPPATPPAAAAPAEVPAPASCSGAGGPPFVWSGSPAISSGGRYVAFTSNVDGLVPGDHNCRYDVFIRDTVARHTQLVSVDFTGRAGNGTSWGPSISAEGRYVAFGSAAALVPGVPGGAVQVYLRDRWTARTSLVSADPNGHPARGGAGFPALSPDGRYVAFAASPDLTGGDPAGPTAIYLRDLWDRTTTLVSATRHGQPADRESNAPALSADGRYVAFSSYASNLVPGDHNGWADVFVRDTTTGHTTLISGTGRHRHGVGYSASPAISPDGRYVAYQRLTPDLAPGYTVSLPEIMLRDMATGRTSVLTTGRQAAASIGGRAAISADDRYVVYPERDTSPPNSYIGEPGLLLLDRRTGHTTIVASGPDRSAPIPGQAEAMEPALSPEGRYLAFTTSTRDIPDPDATGHVYRRDLWTGRTTLIN
ncbi:MAG TPA: hypothetical protein VMU51_12675 [Mycobacteriales bacterium]|nr:hypothetical protein [Mycobacteriales bacterium]